MISDNKKGNPYHDEEGKFASANSFAGKVKKNLGMQEISKPVFDGDFYRNAYKDGYKVEEGSDTATLGEGRIDYLIDEYGVWNENSNYAKAYLTYINPNDFIGATLTNEDTTTNSELEQIQNLDLDRINNESQTMFLDIDFDNGVVVGHEGRHRMKAFASAGIKFVPVVIRNKSESFDKTNTEELILDGNIMGQDFDGVRKGSKINVSGMRLIPLNFKHKRNLLNEFYKENTIDNESI